jgi:hypothetical protein
MTCNFCHCKFSFTRCSFRSPVSPCSITRIASAYGSARQHLTTLALSSRVCIPVNSKSAMTPNPNCSSNAPSVVSAQYKFPSPLSSLPTTPHHVHTFITISSIIPEFYKLYNHIMRFLILTILFATGLAKTGDPKDTPAADYERCPVYGGRRCHKGYWIQECGLGSRVVQCWGNVTMCGYASKCESDPGYHSSCTFAGSIRVGRSLGDLG